jgi:CRISPR-associated protein Cas6
MLKGSSADTQDGGHVVNFVFPVTGLRPIPVDHAYHLYSALCTVFPQLHETVPGQSGGWGSVGILPITGVAVGKRSMRLTSRSRLTIRADVALYSEFLRLAGRVLDVHDCPLTFGIPKPRPLKPVPHLWSRLVVVKGFLEPDAFVEAVRRQLGTMGVTCDVRLQERRSRRSFEGLTGARDDSPYVRRTVRIRDRQIVGYAVELRDLDPRASLAVQERGVGGRRKFGCGIFVPRPSR